MKLQTLLPIYLLFILSSCYRVSDKLDPQVNYAVQDRYLKQLPTAFPNLTEREKQEAWGREYLLGHHFAEDLDFYRAITTFKRAEYLISAKEQDRLFEIQYQIILCYYLGKRYEEVIAAYNHSRLYTVNTSFLAYHDLLVILYESYLKIGDDVKASYTLRTLKCYYPETAKKLELATFMIEGDLFAIKKESLQDPSKNYLSDILNTYEAKKKSVNKAQTLNMVLPGAGYLYVGQKQSAITAFLLNGLFIAASVHFFHKGHLAAGIITASFEAGWYFGGIYGAGEAAKLYNERLYEELAYPALNHNGLFPVLMLNYGF